MTEGAARRRNPPRRSRCSLPEGPETRSHETTDADNARTLQIEQEDQQQRPQVRAANEPSDSEQSESEASSNSGESSTDDDFEEDDVKPLARKRLGTTPSSSKKRRAETQACAVAVTENRDLHSLQLSARQKELLDEIFAEFDTHKNGRISLGDIVRVANDHGFGYGMEEAREMLRFWDTSGTVTISRATFTKLAVEAKFMVPGSK